MNEMTESISDNSDGDDCDVAGKADRDTDDYHHPEIQLQIPTNTTGTPLTKVSNAPKRSSSSSMGNKNTNCANKESRRSSSIATCIHGRDESQCKEYGCIGSAFCIHCDVKNVKMVLYLLLFPLRGLMILKIPPLPLVHLPPPLLLLLHLLPLGRNSNPRFPMERVRI
jgi:hypothetical protein